MNAKMKILLVDDSVKHRRAGKRQLEALGHEVVALCDYTEAREEAKKGGFDVALIDLLMPAEPQTLGVEAVKEFVGTEIAIGFPMAISLAILGIGKIAVVTDTNHHNHPMSAAVDWFQGKVQIAGASVIITHAYLNSDGAKDWEAALKSLTA